MELHFTVEIILGNLHVLVKTDNYDFPFYITKWTLRRIK